MRGTLLLALLVLAPSLHAATDPFAEALTRLPQSLVCGEDARNVVNVVCRAVHDDVRPSFAEAAIARELSVTAETARAIGTAGVATILDQWTGNPTDAATVARLDESLRTALRSETNHQPVLAMLSALAPLTSDAEAFDRSLLPLLRAEVDPVATAIAMTTEWNEPAVAVFFGDVLARRPDDEQAIDAAGRLASQTLLRAALGPLRFTERGATFAARANIAQRDEDVGRQMEVLETLGAAEALVAAYDALPPDLQLRAATSERRLDLAAAAIVAGREALARTIARSLPAATEEDAAKAMLLRIALNLPGKPSFFDAAVRSFSDRRNFGGVGRRLFALVAERSGQPEFAAQLLRDGSWWIDEAVKQTPVGFAAWTAPLERALQAQRIADDARIALLAPASAATAPSRPSLLARPRLMPYTEHTLASVRDDVPGGAIVVDCSDAARVAEATTLPSFLHPIRMERSGNEVVAVTISAALDPVGELGLGGYWIVLSRDGGATWSEYYTGLRQNVPYVVTPASTLPMIAGDRLRIEVEVQELDRASITFPPVALRTLRTQKGLYLDFDLAALTSDRDGDGLTDLVEERIATDPDSADTDGDGIGDAEDPLPQVAWQPRTDPRAEAIAAAFDGHVLGGGRIVTGIDGGIENSGAPAANTCGLRSSLIGERMLFINGDRAAFAPLTIPGRTVVLSDAELETYQQKFGPTYAATIRYLLVDSSGTHALIDISEQWSGQTLLLTKTPAGWTVTPLTSWIT